VTLTSRLARHADKAALRPPIDAAGYTVVEHGTDDAGGVAVPLVRMRKSLTRRS
jgi:hypothetical protein